MDNVIQQSWQTLCQQAAAENDADQLERIISELNLLLEQRQNELRAIQGKEATRPEGSSSGQKNPKS